MGQEQANTELAKEPEIKELLNNITANSSEIGEKNRRPEFTSPANPRAEE